MPLDTFGRTIDYLRISVIDHCNLRCVYCMPLEGLPWMRRSELLTYEDIERIVAGAPDRLHTGGWLLVEHGFEQAEAVCERLLKCGFTSVMTRTDLAGRPRVSGGRYGQSGR